MKHLIQSLFISLVVGLGLSVIFSFLFAEGDYYPLSPVSTMGQLYYDHFSSTGVMLMSIIIWLLIGIVFFIGSLIFNHTDWSITLTTLLHFIFTYITFLPLAILAGWFPLELSYILFFTSVFIIIYLVLWSYHYFKNKKYVNQINQQIHHTHNYK